jgi:hypothetical protein
MDLTTGGSDGWQNINTAYLADLIRMTRTTPEVRAVYAVCYNNMMSGDIQIESIDQATTRNKKKRSRESEGGAKPSMQKKFNGVVPRPDNSERLEYEDPEDEVERQQRSIMWGRFMEHVSIVEVAIGFAIVSYRPNTDYLSIKHSDPLQPCVLEMERLVIRHRINVYSQHEWQVFEKATGAATFSGGDQTANTHMNLRPIKNIKVVGKDFPDNNGIISSRMTRILSGPYQLYVAKMNNTFVADFERSRPTTFMQIQENKDMHDDKTLTGDPTFAAARGVPPPNREQRQDIMRNIAEVAISNLCGGDGSSVGLPRPPGGGGPGGPGGSGVDAFGGVSDESDGKPKYQLPLGREIAQNHMAEAPADLLPARLAFFEAVCLQFGMPMSMLSTGDSSGKAKLNSSHAGAETARIFVEAQATRKREAKLLIEDVHEFMYGDKMSKQFFEDVFQETGMKPKFSDTEKARRVTVTMPANPDIDTIMLLHTQGVLRWPAVARALAIKTGFSVNSFNTTPQLKIEDLAFGEPKPAPPAKPSVAKSTASKKKN